MTNKPRKMTAKLAGHVPLESSSPILLLSMAKVRA